MSISDSEQERQEQNQLLTEMVTLDLEATANERGILDLALTFDLDPWRLKEVLAMLVMLDGIEPARLFEVLERFFGEHDPFYVLSDD